MKTKSSPSVGLLLQMKAGSRLKVFLYLRLKSNPVMLAHANLCSVSLHATLKWFFVSAEFKTDGSCVPERTSGLLGGRSSAPLKACQSSAFPSFLMYIHVIILHF